jgi:hypothetical protein
MTSTKPSDDIILETLFAATRSHAPEPPQALADRVMVAALAEQPHRTLPLAAPLAKASFWDDMARAIGGWRGAGGLGTAMVLGLFIGLSGALDTPLYGTTVEVVDLMPGADALFADTTTEN